MRGRKTATGLGAATDVVGGPGNDGMSGIVMHGVRTYLTGIDPSGSFLAEYVPRRSQLGA